MSSNRKLSKFACERNCERLAEKGRLVYLWTFTTADAPEPKECAFRWKKAVSQLTRSLDFFGVRVFEMHPSGHGMHVHLVTSRRFDVNLVREITTRCGFGRINVKSIPASASKYVAKYLGKQRGCSAVQLPKGTRAWAIVGKGNFGLYTRVKDCEHNTPGKREYDFLRLLFRPRTASQRMGLARAAWMLSQGLLRMREASIFGDGFVVAVAGTGWEFHLTNANAYGFDCQFSESEAIK